MGRVGRVPHLQYWFLPGAPPSRLAFAVSFFSYVDFRAKVPNAFTNRAVATILDSPYWERQLFPFDLYRRPDLVAAPITGIRPIGLVYEIKAAWSRTEGLAQVQEYVDILNIFDHQRHTWITGDAESYKPITPITVLGQKYRINAPDNGVITYEPVDESGNPTNPVVDPNLIKVVSIGLAITAALLALELTVGGESPI